MPTIPTRFPCSASATGRGFGQVLVDREHQHHGVLGHADDRAFGRDRDRDAPPLGRLDVDPLVADAAGLDHAQARHLVEQRRVDRATDQELGLGQLARPEGRRVVGLEELGLELGRLDAELQREQRRRRPSLVEHPVRQVDPPQA
jgi:hypothetical protein